MEKPYCVIDFVRKRKEAKALSCECYKVIGDPVTQLFECLDCGSQWNAYKWIYHATTHTRWLRNDVKELTESRDSLTEEVAKLKSQRSYLRSKLK